MTDTKQIAGALRALADQIDPPRRAAPAQGPGIARTHAPQRPAPRSSDARCPIGKNRGELLEQISDADLAWLRRVLEENLHDPAKSNWRSRNEADLANVDAELARRGAEADGVPQAPSGGDDEEIPF